MFAAIDSNSVLHGKFLEALVAAIIATPALNFVVFYFLELDDLVVDDHLVA